MSVLQKVIADHVLNDRPRFDAMTLVALSGIAQFACRNIAKPVLIQVGCQQFVNELFLRFTLHMNQQAFHVTDGRGRAPK